MKNVRNVMMMMMQMIIVIIIMKTIKYYYYHYYKIYSKKIFIRAKTCLENKSAAGIA